MKPFIILAVAILIMGSQCAYNKEWSKVLNRISAVTHCSKDQIVNWSCRICREGEGLTNISYIYN